MKETLAARDFILDFLRKELVGPWPVSPNIQPNGEEVLRPQDPPKQRYGAGVLFPLRAPVPSQDESADDEDFDADADSLAQDGIVEGPDQSNRSDDDELTPETDQEVNLANQYLPSAMGISALVDLPERLQVTVSTATYTQEESIDVDGTTLADKSWFRRPIERTVEFHSKELAGPKVKTAAKPVLTVDGMTVLELHVISRPHEGSSETRLLTVTLVNRMQSKSQTPRNTECFFQCKFEVSGVDGVGCFRQYPERPVDTSDPEELSLRLLYSHKLTFAVGHGCAADWEAPTHDRTSSVRTEVLPVFEVKPILPTPLVGVELSMSSLAMGDQEVTLRLCSALADSYEEWINQQEKLIADWLDLEPEVREAAHRHLENCRECLRRMREGIDTIERDPEVGVAFALMNESMLMQQAHYRIASEQPRQWVMRSRSWELESSFVRPSYEGGEHAWHPFQLAFILMNIRSISDPKCNDREIVDVIWFPTGGGKTEAYLGLSAFTMFLRRLLDPDHGGTCILMRYTLRLLTTQQFQRAASMICASEIIRRRDCKRLGSEPFSIGLWVGSGVTPNDEAAAIKIHRKLQQDPKANQFVLLSCPWCGAGMGPQGSTNKLRVKGYKVFSRPKKRVRHLCEDHDCDFSAEPGLPVAVIDEHIYSSPPTLVIGTVDKFAMLAYRPEAKSIFGIGTANPPPNLIIQDELHLISGPLGSMVGHYETVIDALCTNELDGSRIRPKVVASTATIARAESQVKALYGRSAFVFPPQALKAGDSFFAEERDDEVGRSYVGVFASALPSHVTSQVRTMGALLQAPKSFATTNPEVIDPYWTMMAYFNSLRELGHAATLIRADIREYMNALWDRIGIRLAEARKAKVDPRRFINRDVELTSRVQSSDIPRILLQLFSKYSNPTDTEAVDACFATNMIQVGLDIPRLSLMTVIGQPKTTSEYIQASSRIGRRHPGIVVTNYNPSRSRDRSHYEHFRSYHQSLYQHVEPTSVTPFAISVRERALHALVVILSRFWGQDSLSQSPQQPPDNQLIDRIIEVIRGRVMSDDPREWQSTERQINEIIQQWIRAPRSIYGDFKPPTEEIPMMYPAGSQIHPLWIEEPYATPSSMRNVDVSCSARPLVNGYLARSADR